MSAFTYPPSNALPEHRARIEIIPLIDVIFFLLATFVLFTLSLDRREAIPLTLPDTDPIRPPAWGPPAEPVMLQISDAGRYFWDQELISLPEVKVRLAHYAQQPDARVMLASDDRANYGLAIKLLDEVRLAGIAEVSVETRHRPTGR